MAFARKELSLMAYNGVSGGGNKFWFYLNSASDDVTAANFFDDMAEDVSDNDLIFVATTGLIGKLTESGGTVTYTAIAAQV